MSKLNTMENVVLKILENSPAARKDDYVLMWLVTSELKPNLAEQRFADVLYNHKENGLPNWETVTRCRRKIQQKRPDLIIEGTARKRHKEEEIYKEYAKS